MFLARERECIKGMDDVGGFFEDKICCWEKSDKFYILNKIMNDKI